MPALESSSVVQIGEWTVQPAIDCIWRGTETQKLEPRTMRLLMCLAESAGEVVSIDRLLTEVWAGVVVGSASVYEAVSQLRKILGDVDAQPTYIVTVPRKGYRLIAPVQRGSVPAETPSAPDTLSRNVTGRRVWVVAGTVVVIGLAAAYLSGQVWLSKDTASKGQQPANSVVVSDKSIAVLPFTDMSEKRDQEYFADGMAEEVINLLVKIPGLKVISRTSSFQFKGKTGDLRNVGTELGVAYVLEGSVRKSGDRLRVTAQLVNSRDGTHLWSQTYDRELSDVLKMQDEIAAQVVRAMQIEVSAADLASRPALRNPEAYTLYLQGLHANDRFDQQGWEKAASYFQRALDLDPSFAEAAAQLAGAYDILGQFNFMQPAVAFEQARHTAEHALELNPNLAFAHAVLGDIYMAYWDWPGADREMGRAVALGTNDGLILQLAARQSLNMGRWDHSLELVNASLTLDPLNPFSYLVLSWIQIHRGRLAEAETAIRRTIEISPTFTSAHFHLGIVLFARDQRKAAAAEFLKETDNATHLEGSVLANFVLAREADSDAALAQMIAHYANYPFSIAETYAFRGEPDEAFKWLDRSYARKDINLLYIVSDPVMKTLVGDPRYKALLKKMNWPE
jgi:TolB-like protein/DNA-binding winged helix-turn-helix (wHTH) protein/Tfp pilus assembly protein PilF